MTKALSRLDKDRKKMIYSKAKDFININTT